MRDIHFLQMRLALEDQKWTDKFYHHHLLHTAGAEELKKVGQMSTGIDTQVERGPQYFIHAYVMCDRYDGDLAHSCRHGEGPHLNQL